MRASRHGEFLLTALEPHVSDLCAMRAATAVASCHDVDELSKEEAGGNEERQPGGTPAIVKVERADAAPADEAAQSRPKLRNRNGTAGVACDVEAQDGRRSVPPQRAKAATATMETRDTRLSTQAVKRKSRML